VNRESSTGFEIGSSPENLVGIGETGGVQNSEDDRDWSFEFWFLIFLDQRRNDNGVFRLLHGCARPPAPSSVPLLEMSSKRNLTDCYLSSFLFLKSGLYFCVFFLMLILVWKCGQRVGDTLYPPITDGRSLTMIVSDLITVYTSL
jgi:hypothetical protein